jgi:hypothetical protein
MQLRLRASFGLVALVLAVPAVVATGAGPAAAAGVPHLDSVTPNHAYVGYSYPITIVGSHLTGATSVDFNAVNPRVAASFVVVDDSTITAMTPALGAFSSGTTLSVTTPSGTSNGLPFTWTFTQPVPVVTAITPASGRLSGGQRIAIVGIAVNSGTSVTFGGTPATIVGGNGPGEIDVSSPAHAAGAVDVVVTTGGGSATTTNGYLYLDVPGVTAVSPGAGAATGGASVTITGTGLGATTSVKFGTTPTASFVVDSSTSITATIPAHSVGVVDVTVTSPGGTSSVGAADQFSFDPIPVVTAVSPGSGGATGGTSVTITGTGLDDATAVSFGTTPASFVVDSSTSITATTPAHATGVVDVTVSSPGGTSSAAPGDEFTFGDVPAVSALVPSAGVVDGGTSVTITGTDLGGVTAVLFGTTPASFVVVSDTSITAMSPAHSIGVVEATVVGPFGTSLGSSVSFTYTAPDPTPDPTPSPTPYSSTCCRTVTAAGRVFGAGGARTYGDLRGRRLRASVVGLASTPTGAGYWLVSSDGGVFAFGDASFFGSLSGRALRRPIVAMAASSDGRGYLLVASDGGVFAFGDARFAGSMAGRRLNAPIVGVAADAGGYRLVAGDGGVFTFGKAAFFGSMGTTRLGAPIVGISRTIRGYVLVGLDGGVFAFGDAPMYGSTSGETKGRAIVGIVADARGYLIAARDGARFAFSATARAVQTATPVDAPIVGVG